MLLGIPPWRTGDLPPQCPPRQRPRSSRTSRPWVLGFFYKLGIHQKLHFYSIFFNPKMYFLDSSSYLFILILWLKKYGPTFILSIVFSLYFLWRVIKTKQNPIFMGFLFQTIFNGLCGLYKILFFLTIVHKSTIFIVKSSPKKQAWLLKPLHICRSRSIIHDEFAIFHGDPLVMTNSLLLKPWPNRNSWWIPTQNGDVLQLS